MLVSRGYPESYKKNIEMTGFEEIEDSLLFQLGQKIMGIKYLLMGAGSYNNFLWKKS